MSEIFASVHFKNNGDQIDFRNVEEMIDFVNAEHEFWSFIKQVPDSQSYQQFKKVACNHLNKIANLHVALNRDREIKSTLVSTLQNHFSAANVFFPLSTRSVAQSIKGMFDDAEDQDDILEAFVALAYIGFNRQNIEIPSNPIHMQAVLRLTLEELGISDKGSRAAKKAMKQGYTLRQKQVEKEIENTEKVAELLREEVEKTRAKRNHWANDLTEKWESDKANNDQYISQAVQSLEDTREVYEKAMELRAPSNYWINKAKGHEKRSWIWGCISAGWLVVAVSTSIAGFFWFQSEIETLGKQTNPSAPLASYLVISGFALLATTLGLWLGRVFVRLFLSELHLGMDARERVAMVMSYLALTAKDKATDADRHIILNALFRPTEDGIVKDDASSDPNIAALISRISKP